MQNQVLKIKPEISDKATSLNTANFPLWLNNFINIYQTLSIDNLDLLKNIYHQDITFIDPIHKVQGYDNLVNYFEGLYENLSTCEFIIEQVIVQDSHAALYWKMSYQHAKLNKGKTVTVLGTSHIEGKGDKVYYHRDYLDLGVMLYEQLPIIGRLIRWIKKRAAN